LFFVVNIIFSSLAVLLLSSNSLDYQWFRRMGTQSRWTPVTTWLSAI